MLPSRSRNPAERARTVRLGLALIATLVLPACDEARVRAPAGQQHPDGWTDPKSAAFHGKDLKTHGFPLAECKTCHGADYQGGPVGVGCTSAGCHTQPDAVEFCGTCHGGEKGPRPDTGAHPKHVTFCSECHAVPTEIGSLGHLNGIANVRFSGKATLDGAKPSWNADTRTCSSVYCHGSGKPVWEAKAGETLCTTCHDAPPHSHTRFAYVATLDTCEGCHAVPPGEKHIDGVTELLPMACDTCHGSGPEGAPGASLDGSMDPQNRGVGAHRRHLDPTLPDRMGPAVACARCHEVPDAVLAKGHLDTSEPADLNFVGDESYSPATQTCVVRCHGSNAPGPTWTDNSGAARACDACHGFPPVYTENGTLHTIVEGTLSACLGCHPFDPATHVDGTVDFHK